jgi:GDP/UDP-N,N'-diacetylbacillosamine 2-epimerase (hydrolysing)
VGLRQEGRERAENVLDCRAEEVEIRRTIDVALSRHFRESLGNLVNPYGKGYATAKIVRILTSLELSESLLVKKAPPIQPIADYEHSIY